MVKIITDIARRYFTGKESQFEFKRSNQVVYSKIDKINLYIHIPFCNHLCPYCPYNKVKYELQKVPAYLKALLNEIEMYHSLFGNIQISSVYIGGGTPTLLMDELGVIFEHLNMKFRIAGDLCIEVNPCDIKDKLIGDLKKYKINLVSVGVQSFLDKNLKFIGRKCEASTLKSALKKLVEAKFKSVNIDLMFALPGQTIKDLNYDLQTAVDCGIDQITTYPLFTFPYSTIGKYLKLKKVRMPKLSVRHNQYYHIHNYLSDNGFSRVSVWGFKKGITPRYSSVTRDNYIGIGAGAGSHLSNGFYLNTFSVEEYVKKCLSMQFPTTLYMHFTQNMQNYFWLYWRFYDTCIPKGELYKKFDKNDKKIKRLISIAKSFNLLFDNNDHYELTMQGAFWIHLIQNYFSLRYIDKVWRIAMKEAYPQKIVL